MKTERMFRCLLLMLGGKKLTSAELARELDVSRRSVQRYVESLEDAGFPVVKTLGINGGYSLPSDFPVRGAFFDAWEYGKLSECISAGRIPEADKKKLINKIASISEESREARSDEMFFGDEKDSEEIVEVIGRAVKENRLTEITYVGREGKSSRRTVEPHCLFYRDGIRYVYAFCREREEFRTFKIGRICEALLLGEFFEKKDFLLETDISLRPSGSEKVSDITFFIEECVYDDVASKIGEDKITPCGKRYLAHSSELIDKALIRLFLYLGKDAEIIQPLTLKTAVAKEADEIATKFRS